MTLSRTSGNHTVAGTILKYHRERMGHGCLLTGSFVGPLLSSRWSQVPEEDVDSLWHLAVFWCFCGKYKLRFSRFTREKLTRRDHLHPNFFSQYSQTKGASVGCFFLCFFM